MATALDFERVLGGVALHVSRPRVAVLTAVHAHPHAGTDSIIGATRRDLPDVPHQAVHDVLSTLTAAGPALRIRPSRPVDRYESRVGSKHHHVLCRSRCVIANVDCAAGEAPCLTSSRDRGFPVDEDEVIYRSLRPGRSATHSS